MNNEKTEALSVGPRKRVSVSQENHLRVGNHDISTKDHVKKSLNGFELFAACTSDPT